MAKNNDGAPGVDGVTFEAIEESERKSFLKQIQDELVQYTYQPMRVRKKEIPKDGGTKAKLNWGSSERHFPLIPNCQKQLLPKPCATPKLSKPGGGEFS